VRCCVNHLEGEAFVVPFWVPYHEINSQDCPTCKRARLRMFPRLLTSRTCHDRTLYVLCAAKGRLMRVGDNNCGSLVHVCVLYLFNCCSKRTLAPVTKRITLVIHEEMHVDLQVTCPLAYSCVILTKIGTFQLMLVKLRYFRFRKNSCRLSHSSC